MVAGAMDEGATSSILGIGAAILSGSICVNIPYSGNASTVCKAQREGRLTDQSIHQSQRDGEKIKVVEGQLN